MPLNLLHGVWQLSFYSRYKAVILPCLGLDYSKSTGVGRLLFDICREHGMQLMATSNEEFMMNIVDIGEWNILVRKDQTVKSLNAANHPELFDEFRFSGLDNFDLFTSDVLNRAASNLFTEEE